MGFRQIGGNGVDFQGSGRNGARYKKKCGKILCGKVELTLDSSDWKIPNKNRLQVLDWLESCLFRSCLSKTIY